MVTPPEGTQCWRCGARATQYCAGPLCGRPVCDAHHIRRRGVAVCLQCVRRSTLQELPPLAVRLALGLLGYGLLSFLWFRRLFNQVPSHEPLVAHPGLIVMGFASLAFVLSSFLRAVLRERELERIRFSGIGTHRPRQHP